MDIVLEMAHKVDDTGNNNIPSRELVQEKIIFNCCDILMVTAVDVDLDYAVKGKSMLYISPLDKSLWTRSMLYIFHS